MGDAKTPAAEATGPTGSKRKRAETGGGRKKTAGGKAAEVPLRARRPEEWPRWFQALERTHRALNVVYTFCCTRKHLLTTFATIKTAVEAQTGDAELKESDVAAIACLLASSGGGIHFAYVDEQSLQMDVLGAERDEVFKTGSHRQWRTAQGPASDASVGGITGRQGLGADTASKGEKEVLYFEFVDEDLKRQVPDRKTGEATRPTQRLRHERLRLPVYGQKQMAGLIEKRNKRFAAAVDVFLDGCATADDAEAALRRDAERFVPVPTPKRPETSGSLAADRLPADIPGPGERRSIAAIVQELREEPWYTGQIVPDGHRVVEEQEAVYGELDFLLSQDLVNALYNAKGITQFYAHQAAAINALHAGRHVVVATSTSSGKSLIYQLPVAQALEQDAQARALYIFPTKALAQDQKRSLRELLAYMPGMADVETLVDTFDGDTPWPLRDGIREQARVLFTNPDMLHASVLPQEARWRPFLKELRFVVVDELHYYNGLLGAHVAFVLRRLRRICAALGNDGLRFVACSATVANPVEHFGRLFGIDDNICLVDVDGSPAGRKEFVCWNTPFRVPDDPASGRGSGLHECARLFCALVLRGVRLIAFCRVRAQVEKLVAAVRAELGQLGRPAVADRVMAYRGGYTAQDRRRIEADMFSGRLVGIVATTALELGVDIGSLDGVLVWGFPYSIANLRQQTGRAGRRRGRDALAVLVGDAFATDQHYMQNPDALFDQPLAALQVDLANVLVREGHLQCAAYEMPVRPAPGSLDDRLLGPGLAALCAARLTPDDAGFFHCHASFRPQPWRLVAIRGDDDDTFAIVDVGQQPPVVLEELEADRATFTLYDGAIFLHQGTTYLVRDFDPAKHVARVERVRVDWTTQQRDYTDVDPVETQAVRPIAGTGSGTETSGRAYLGRIRITQVVFGYFKVDRRERILDAVQVDNPPVVRASRGTWLDVPAAGLALLARRRLHAAAALHAAEHAVLTLLPNFVVSLPGDVRTECKSHLKEFQNRPGGTRRRRPARLVFYDAHGGAGGAGMAACAFACIDRLLRQALARIETCACTRGLGLDAASAIAPRGCAECIVWQQCVEANTVLSRAGAVVVLRSLLGLAVDEDALPMGPEEGIPPGPETVVLAQPVPGVREPIPSIDDEIS